MKQIIASVLVALPILLNAQQACEPPADLNPDGVEPKPRMRVRILMAAKILREDLLPCNPWQQKRSPVRLPFQIALDLLY